MFWVWVLGECQNVHQGASNGTGPDQAEHSEPAHLKMGGKSLYLNKIPWCLDVENFFPRVASTVSLFRELWKIVVKAYIFQEIILEEVK